MKTTKLESGSSKPKKVRKSIVFGTGTKAKNLAAVLKERGDTVRVTPFSPEVSWVDGKAGIAFVKRSTEEWTLARFADGADLAFFIIPTGGTEVALSCARFLLERGVPTFLIKDESGQFKVAPAAPAEVVQNPQDGCFVPGTASSGNPQDAAWNAWEDGGSVPPSGTFPDFPAVASASASASMVSDESLVPELGNLRVAHLLSTEDHPGEEESSCG